MRMDPAVTDSRPASMRRMVDFPEPEPPTSTSSSPSATSRSKSSTTVTSPNRLRTCSKVTGGMVTLRSVAPRRSHHGCGQASRAQGGYTDAADETDHADGSDAGCAERMSGRRECNEHFDMARGELVQERLTYSVIGAFFEVYNALGFGFLEHLYATALERELRSRGHRVGREVSVPVFY